MPGLSDIPIQTQQDSQQPQGDSKAFGITIHGWIAMIVVYTICLMSVFDKTISEPLYTIGGMVVAFYFGQKKQTS